MAGFTLDLGSGRDLGVSSLVRGIRGRSIEQEISCTNYFIRLRCLVTWHLYNGRYLSEDQGMEEGKDTGIIGRRWCRQTNLHSWSYV